MNNTNPYTDLVIRYFEDDLSSEEKITFDAEILTNDSLKEEYENQQKMNAILDDKDLHSFYNTMEDVEAEIAEEERKRKQRMFIWYASAASVAVILSFTFLIPILRKPTGKVLFAENYSMAPSIIADRSVSEELLPLEEGLLAYDNKEFSQSTDVFVAYLKEDTNNITAQFFLGLSYIEQEQTEKAITRFKLLTNQKPNLYSDQAEWYLALCYLKADKIDEAKQVLQIMADKNHYKKGKALEILKQLE